MVRGTGAASYTYLATVYTTLGRTPPGFHPTASIRMPEVRVISLKSRPTQSAICIWLTSHLSSHGAVPNAHAQIPCRCGPKPTSTTYPDLTYLPASVPRTCRVSVGTSRHERSHRWQ